LTDVLSQNEIDDLLRALVSGTPESVPEDEEAGDGRAVRTYDFRTADKFSREQMRTLTIVFENYAQSISGYLAGALRTMCSVEIVSVEERLFGEFNNSLPDPVVLTIFDMPPIEGSCLMEISPTVAYSIVSHVFGGGDSIGNTSKAFTEIELASLTRIVRQMLGRMGEAWARVVEVSPMLDRIETSPQFAQIISQNDTIAIITLNVSIGKTSDFINICIPHIAIEPIAQLLSTKLWFSSSTGKTIRPQTELIRNRLLSTKVTMQAVFSETYADVGEVMSLQPGDVIQLNHSVHSPLDIKVEQLLKFRGWIGTHSKRYAIRVSEVVKEDRGHE